MYLLDVKDSSGKKYVASVSFKHDFKNKVVLNTENMKRILTNFSEKSLLVPSPSSFNMYKNSLIKNVSEDSTFKLVCALREVLNFKPTSEEDVLNFSKEVSDYVSSVNNNSRSTSTCTIYYVEKSVLDKDKEKNSGLTVRKYDKDGTLVSERLASTSYRIKNLCKEPITHVSVVSKKDTPNKRIGRLESLTPALKELLLVLGHSPEAARSQARELSTSLSRTNVNA